MSVRVEEVNAEQVKNTETAPAASRIGGRPAGKRLRIGFVGVGDRGLHHLDTVVGMEGVEVPAICDVDAGYLDRAKRWIVESGKSAPVLYDRGPEDFRRLCEQEDLDLVVCSTPWESHAAVCLAAMRSGKHAATEVPAALTLDECWELVETAEASGRHCVMLEQANYKQEGLQVLRMARQGLFGELLFATGGYVHDLRHVKFDPHREPWRLQHSVDRNGNLYPTHPMGPIAWWIDINRGDRFEYLVSMSSKAVMLNEYAAHHFGERHPYAGMKMKQGDVNTTMLHTVGGKVVVLYFDTNTPHPQTSELRLQGTKGHYSGSIQSVYLEGTSPEEHQWEPLGAYQAEFEHSLWRGLDHKRYKTARGHGGGLTTPIMWERLVSALQGGRDPDQNVYDAVTWSAIVALSERSVATKSVAVDFPDFTRGKWKTTPPIGLE